MSNDVLYVSDRQIRANIFRKDAKAGTKDIITYLRRRAACADPLLWPPRPTLTVIGVKNSLERLRSDLLTIESHTGKNTTNLVRIVRGSPGLNVRLMGC